MNIFISGGCKNGKSLYGQNLAKEQSHKYSLPLYYVATMVPVDEEDRQRIKRHIEDRNGFGFTTIEQSQNICQCLKNIKDVGGVFLIDSVTALLSNEMFRSDGTVDLDGGERVKNDLVRFAELTGNAIFVSDYIYSDSLIYDKFTELYRKNLGYIDRSLARVCDKVIEVTYGAINHIK